LELFKIWLILKTEKSNYNIFKLVY